MKSTRCFVPFVLFLLAIGCGRQTPAPITAQAPPSSPTPAVVPAAATESDAILAVIRANIDAINREDIDASMAVFASDSPVLQATRDATEKIFQAYDLRYTMEELVVDSVSGDEAKVRFSQLTEKVSGPEFRNNRFRGVHTLKKQDGVWKLYGTETTGIEFLDE